MVPRPTLPKFSGDGKWLYFQSNASGRWNVYRSRTDGSETQNLTSDIALGEEIFGFALHPQSPRMTFTSASSGVSRVGVMDLDGDNAVVPRPDLGYHYMAAPSPDGSEIVFSHTQEGYVLKRMNYDGTNLVSLLPNLPNSYVPQYTPDGQAIVFIRNDGDLYCVRRDGSNLMRLTTGNNYYTFYITSPTGDLPTNADEQHGSTDVPSISPDGSQIAYIGRPAGGAPQVFVMDIDGTDQRQLTSLSWACGRVQWSPSGDQLAFVSFDGANGRSQLFVMDSDGRNLRQLTSLTDRSVNFITWNSTVLVPEPALFVLLASGGLGLALFSRRPAILRLRGRSTSRGWLKCGATIAGGGARRGV